jgi:hypothetical protein
MHLERRNRQLAVLLVLHISSNLTRYCRLTWRVAQEDIPGGWDEPRDSDQYVSCLPSLAVHARQDGQRRRLPNFIDQWGCGDQGASIVGASAADPARRAGRSSAASSGHVGLEALRKEEDGSAGGRAGRVRKCQLLQYEGLHLFNTYHFSFDQRCRSFEAIQRLSFKLASPEFTARLIELSAVIINYSKP